MFSLIPVVGWFRVVGALVFFLGPGMALVSIHPRRLKMDKTQTVILAFVVSFSCWAILLVWLQPLGVVLNSLAISVIFGVGWALALWRYASMRRGAHPASPGQKGMPPGPRYALWGLLAFAAVLHISLLHDSLVGPGSDSLHHTIIARLFELDGGIPSNYAPMVPLATFRYHFGFHAFVYAVNEFGQLPYEIATPVLSQFLVAFSGMTAAYFVERLTGKAWAGLAAAATLGLGLVFPAYLIQWGRYPQAAGLMLLPVFLAELISWKRAESRRTTAAFLGLLAAGIALTHYRMAILAALAAGVIFLVVLFARDDPREKWGDIIAGEAELGLASAVFVAPWMITLLLQSGTGYPPQFKALKSTFFSLGRLGGSVQYPTNLPVLGLILLAVLLGLRRSNRTVIMLLLWGIISCLVAFSEQASYFLDPVTTLIALCVPVALIVGVTLAEPVHGLGRAIRLAEAGLALGIVAAGAVATRGILAPATFTVTPADLQAMDWIKSNTPEGAVFAVNTNEIGFLPGFVYGSDAGYWMPVLADRGAATLPLIYSFENTSFPGYVEKITQFVDHEGDLTTSSGLETLAELGATYVYIGDKGGPIQTGPLQSSSSFKLVYNRSGVQIYALVPASSGIDGGG